MLISLLPVATYASSPMPKVTLNDPNGSIKDEYVGGKQSLWYVSFQSVTDNDGNVGTRPMYTTTKPKDNYIQFEFDSYNDIFYITFNNVNYKRTSTAKEFLSVTNNSGYDNQFDVVLTLNGTNKLSGTNVVFTFNTGKNITVTGSGSLDIDTLVTSESIFWAKGSGDLTFLNTTVKMYNCVGYEYKPSAMGTVAAITNKGGIIIDGSNMDINGGYKSSALLTASKASGNPTSPATGIVIKHGSNVTLESNSVTTVKTNGPIIFDNSNISIIKGTGNNKPVFNQAPELIGTYSSRKGGTIVNSKVTMYMYPGSYGLKPGDEVLESHKLNRFELIHKCEPSDCTKESLCLCTKNTAPATAEKHVIEQVEAQEATCVQTGWEAYEYCVNCAYSTKVEIPATGEHTIVYVKSQSATCGEAGWYTHEYCEVCDYSTKVEIPATGRHIILQAPAKAPTCGEFGWEAHEYCSGCTTYTTRVVIPATGDHDLVYVDAKEATFSEPGWEAYKYCKNCDFSTKEEIPATGIVTLKPFYLLNKEAPWDPSPYIYTKPTLWTENFKTGQTVPTVSWVGHNAYCNGTNGIPNLAAKLKAEFDDRPAGTRYFCLDMMTKVMHALVEHNVYYDTVVETVQEWLDAFLAEYYKIGGKLDGIQVDVEYVYGGSWYIHLARSNKNPSNVHNDPDIYWNIVNDERYATEIRPRLEALGFPFLDASKQDDIKSEIYGIDTQNSTAYNIWNVVNNQRMVEAISEAVYEPLIKYYPKAWVTDYQVRYSFGWQKAHNSSASALLGNKIGLGTTSNFNAYSARPNDDIYGYGDSQSYTTPASYNAAAYELTAFNTALWELNIFKDMYDATPSGRTAAHVGYFNYNPKRKGTYANTPYYTETLLHIGLMDPVAYMGYIREEEVFRDGKNSNNPLIGDFGYNMNVASDIMQELSRVAGASDRKIIPVSSYWNSKFILSGIYAGGRNVWRITPDTYTGVTLEQFKVKDKVPTFYINGQTIIFPQGRIIKDGSVRQVGTCGYWVETPAGVNPVIINDTDRYSKFPSLLEDFEDYTVGAEFNSTTALPATCWDVTGSAATIQNHNGSRALALHGSTDMFLMKLPSNITAGDRYAKQQAWEVTVTVPSSGQLTLLTVSNRDNGVRIVDGKVYYAYGDYSLQLSGVTLTAGSTYIIKREVDFRATNAFKSSFTVYDANGKRLGGIDNVPMSTVVLPLSQIGLSCSSIAGTAYIDDVKMYPTGVTTDFEVYDVETGLKVADPAATRNVDSAYRLSWMNASSEYKVAKVYNGSTLLKEIKMAPGQDGVVTGIVTGSNIRLSVVTENDSLETLPDYDQGDFSWTCVAEEIGLATGNTTVTTYTVEFKDWDGTVLSSKTYLKGEAVTAPANPARSADDTYTYTFNGWDKEVVKCAGDASYTATYTSTYIDYTVVFENWDGTILSTNTYHYGDKITAPANPTRPAEGSKTYSFTGWDKAVTTCSGSMTFTAVYSANSIVPTVITSSTYTVSNGTISKIPTGTTVSAFLSKINDSQYAKVYKDGQEVTGDAVIATGMVIRLQDGSYSKASATIVVTGDTSGDGKITVTDMLAIKAHILKKSTLSDAYAQAADTSGDSAISITDFLQLKAHILGKSNVTP